MNPATITATAKHTESKREKEKTTVKEKGRETAKAKAMGKNPMTTRKARENPPPASRATRPRAAGVNSGWE